MYVIDAFCVLLKRDPITVHENGSCAAYVIWLAIFCTLKFQILHQI